MLFVREPKFTNFFLINQLDHNPFVKLLTQKQMYNVFKTASQTTLAAHSVMKPAYSLLILFPAG